MNLIDANYLSTVNMILDDCASSHHFRSKKTGKLEFDDERQNLGKEEKELLYNFKQALK